MKHLGAEANIYAQIAEKRAQGKSEAKLQAKKQAIESQIAQMLLPPASQRIFDKGVTWEDIGIDLMLIDEAQNFKNLFVPKTDFSSPPKFLGANPPSKASYNLDIRVMQVRSVAQQKYGSNNIFLLSATPAKNSPIQWDVDACRAAFHRLGMLRRKADQALQAAGITDLAERQSERG